MKVLQINVTCGRGSTGRIATDLADVLAARGQQCRIAYGRDTVPEKYQDIAVRIGSDWDARLHGVATRVFDAHGFASKGATARFLDWVRDYDPDVIHLHNIHGYYINVEMLFGYLKQAGKPVIWTLHDCWAFTGHCSHFSAAGCGQWKTHCAACPLRGDYPKCMVPGDVSKNYTRKKAAFTGLPGLTIVTPSNWLAGLVSESFLQEYPVRVIPSGIDLSVFHPVESEFRRKYGLQDCKIVLGVANVWGKSKGLQDLTALSALLPEPYKIVLVGLSDQQIQALPKNVLGLPRTRSTEELAEIYSAADIFVNPSVEETQGLTTVEALACGTPVITYNRTAVPEAVTESCGIVVDCGPDKLAEAVQRISCSSDACLRRAAEFDKRKMGMQYMELYEQAHRQAL